MSSNPERSTEKENNNFDEERVYIVMLVIAKHLYYIYLVKCAQEYQRNKRLDVPSLS